MSYLLLPDDERDLVVHLVEDLGLEMIASPALTRKGSQPWQPRFASEPLASVSSDLPLNGASSMLFWSASLGNLIALGDRGRSDDARSRVGLHLARQASLAGWSNLIDFDRSPVIRWRRCWWRENGHMTPGVLQGMAEVSRLWPPELTRQFRSIERWMQKGATRVDPFEHCENPPVVPMSRRTFLVWARPAAARWVDDGGLVWPWTS